jgi:hypothetical protein
MVLLLHGFFSFDLLITSHQSLLLLDMSFLLPELVLLPQIVHILQRSLHRHLLLDGLHSLLLKHSVVALLHEEVVGGQRVCE